MSLADLYLVPRTAEQLRQWSFAHMAHHRDIIGYVTQKTSIVLPEYALDPVPEGPNAQQWGDQHQLMHENVDALLGIDGYDLSEPDFTKPEEMGGWIWLNAELHRQEEEKTGVG